MIHIAIPSLPLSVNHAYANVRGRRMLTKKGKAYKNETQAYIARHYPEELKLLQRDLPYDVLIDLTFKGRETLLTKTWPDGGGKNRYKRLDANNRVKLFEDALAGATGLDDSHNWLVAVGKSWHRDFEATNVWIWCREVERSPLYELLKDLRTSETQ